MKKHLLFAPVVLLVPAFAMAASEQPAGDAAAVEAW